MSAYEVKFAHGTYAVIFVHSYHGTVYSWYTNVTEWSRYACGAVEIHSWYILGVLQELYSTFNIY